MPKHKDLKRLVRARMTKTGESYTTARAQLLTKNRPAPRTGSSGPDPVVSVPDDHERLAGMSDAAVRDKTGKTWPQWVEALDAIGAAGMPHGEIATRVYDDFDGVSDWWAQMVTVGYERLRGLRQKGQRRDGTFDANRSKTFAYPVARVYRACADEKERAGWLPDVDLTIRTATENKSIRITWPDGTSVAIHFVEKGPEKCQVAVQHSKLSDADDVADAKARWGDRLTALAEHLAS